MMCPAFDQLREIITTERLLLRIPRVSDCASHSESVQKSIHQLKPWLPWASEEYGVNDSEDWIRRTIGRFVTGAGASYLVYEQPDPDAVIGGIGAHDIDWKLRKTEIGYWLRTDRAGRGYMTEALIALTAMLESAGVRRIQIRCDERNAASAAVARKGGYALEGTHRLDSADPAGRPCSTHYFARIFETAD